MNCNPEKEKEDPISFSPGPFFSTAILPTESLPAHQPHSLRTESMEKGFQHGIQAYLKKGHGHGSRDAGLEVPLPTIQSFVVTSLWADTRLSQGGCNNALLGVSAE